MSGQSPTSAPAKPRGILPSQNLPFLATIKAYYRLTKPGIIYGNAITAAAGFFLAARGQVDFWLFIATLAGVSTVIAAACVTNNYLDRGIDAKMERTKKRALVDGTITNRSALLYAAILSALGFSILALYTNTLTVAVGLVGIVFYVILYGLAKRRTIYGTEVGSVSGSMPIVAGYIAVTGRFDMTAFLLFLILTLWQMPHFYAIAIYRVKDYAAAGLPVLSVKKGMHQTKVRMLIYTFAFGIAACALAVFGHAGYCYLAVAVIVSTAWLWRGFKGFKTMDDTKWARKMFGFSLLVLLSFSLAISFDNLLP
jgi:protoheme IX farnesyltransferase